MADYTTDEFETLARERHLEIQFSPEKIELRIDGGWYEYAGIFDGGEETPLNCIYNVIVAVDAAAGAWTTTNNPGGAHWEFLTP